MEDYLNLTTPVDISDFLISATGAFSDALAADELLGKEMVKEGYWTRLGNFLTKTNVELTDGIDVGVGLKASLKADPSFRQKVQERMKGHLSALSNDVQRFMEESFKALQKRYGNDVRVVVLFDSIERIEQHVAQRRAGGSVGGIPVRGPLRQARIAIHARRLHRAALAEDQIPRGREPV